MKCARFIFSTQNTEASICKLLHTIFWCLIAKRNRDYYKTGNENEPGLVLMLKIVYLWFISSEMLYLIMHLLYCHCLLTVRISMCAVIANNILVGRIAIYYNSVCCLTYICVHTRKAASLKLLFHFTCDTLIARNFIPIQEHAYKNFEWNHTCL